MNRITLRGKSPIFGSHLCVSLNWLRAVGVMLALPVGLGAVMAPLPVDAVTYVASATVSDTMVAVYGFDTNGDPVLIPDATILNGGIYTEAGFFGTINADDSVTDANNAVVGFVSYAEPDN